MYIQKTVKLVAILLTLTLFIAVISGSAVHTEAEGFSGLLDVEQSTRRNETLYLRFKNLYNS